MGIYIKGMKKPDCCYFCWALDDDGDYPRCRITDECRGFTFNTRDRVMDKCPLIEIKSPHGRLIDEDALCYEVVKKGGVDFIYAATSCIKDTPTVIEADYND